jgi:hypothetical protein
LKRGAERPTRSPGYVTELVEITQSSEALLRNTRKRAVDIFLQNILFNIKYIFIPSFNCWWILSQEAKEIRELSGSNSDNADQTKEKQQQTSFHRAAQLAA